MKKVFESKITALKSSKTRIYPTIRLPKEYSEIIGKKADIFLTEYQGKLAFLVVVDTESLNVEVEDTLEARLSKLENIVSKLYNAVFGRNNLNNPQPQQQKSQGPDSNRGIADLQSAA